MVTNCYPECTRTHHFDIKIQKFFWGGGTAPSPDPIFGASHQILATPLCMYVAELLLMWLFLPDNSRVVLDSSGARL